MLCKYRDALGKVGKGIHSYRLFNIAIVDVLMTFIGAYFIYLLFPHIEYIKILIGLFILGIFLHRIFCVPTTIDRLLFRSH